VKVFSFYVELVSFPVIGETGWNGGWNDSWTLEEFPDKETLLRDSDILYHLTEFAENLVFDGDGLKVRDEFTGEEFIDLKFTDGYSDPDNQVECDYTFRVTNAYVVDGLNWQIDYVETATLDLTVTGDNEEQAKHKCEELAKKFFELNEGAIMEVNFFSSTS
jgi:hypothetical protein